MYIYILRNVYKYDPLSNQREKGIFPHFFFILASLDLCRQGDVPCSLRRQALSELA